MTLAALLAAASAVLVWLGLTSAASWLARRDHRCTIRTRSTSCGQCAAVRRGEALGGHVVCACGAVSPHRVGVDLLRWRAEHHGEQLPALPGELAPATRGPSAVLGPDPEPAKAAAALLEATGEAQRRAIVLARRNPDPVTPQVLREAGYTGPAPKNQAQESADADIG